MRKLTAFTFASLDGYYKSINDDISWHQHGAEEGEFSADSLKSGNVLLFGRVTYEMMAKFWPTAEAIHNTPAIANGMNRAEKIVFSNTVTDPTWNNTRVINGDIISEVKRLKLMPGSNMTILGSGSILSQFSEHRLIDEYQIMIDPVVLGAGTSIFKGINHMINLELTNSRIFGSGVVLLTYKRRNLK